MHIKTGTSLIGAAAICLSSLGCNPDAHESDIQNLNKNFDDLSMEYDVADADLIKRIHNCVSEDVRNLMRKKAELCNLENIVCKVENGYDPLCQEISKREFSTRYKGRGAELEAEISGRTLPKNSKNHFTSWIEGACKEKAKGEYNKCLKQEIICIKGITE